MSFISIFILVLIAAIILAILYAFFHMLIVFIPVIFIVAIGIWIINRLCAKKGDSDLTQKEEFSRFDYFSNYRNSESKKRKQARDVTTKDIDDDNKRN